MHIVIFGLTVSSSWGNGHATLWRSLIRALSRRGHTTVFYEKDVPYYAGNRDLCQLTEGAHLRLYQSSHEIVDEARSELAHADLAICTSFCPDGVVACSLVLDSNAGIRVFYDMDTPVTLNSVRNGKAVGYLPADGLAGFDLVLSYTGGRALTELQSRLGARAVAPLYGWVDPQTHYPVERVERFRGALSYLGTYAEDRQAALNELFLEPARRLPRERFVMAGAQYPGDFPWSQNLFFSRHLEPAQHSSFFCSARATLNVTRQAMAQYGYCPSGRLFEAAACGAPILSDAWAGLETFFSLGEEILEVRSAADVLDALALSDLELLNMARAARARTLEEHTAERRARELEALCEQVLVMAAHEGSTSSKE